MSADDLDLPPPRKDGFKTLGLVASWRRALSSKTIARLQTEGRQRVGI